MGLVSGWSKSGLMDIGLCSREGPAGREGTGSPVGLENVVDPVWRERVINPVQ